MTSQNHDEKHIERSLVYSELYLPNEGKLKPEPDKSGNIEYKLRLDRKDAKACTRMVSQMLWRISEGNNEAHYILGVHDDGSFSTISETELNITIGVLKGIVKSAKAKVISEKIYVFSGNHLVAHVTIRKDFSHKFVSETKVVICGPYGVGKSTTMSNITYGQKDDGFGFSRTLVLRHQHEKNTGSTSCPKYDTIGFSGKYLLNYAVGVEFNLENIYCMADRMLDIIDVPGDMKYIKTILYIVSSLRPEYLFLCVPLSDTIETNDQKNDIDKLQNKTSGKKTLHPRVTLSTLIHDMSIDEMPNVEEIEDTKYYDVRRDLSNNVKKIISKYKKYYGLIVAICTAYKIKPTIIFTKSDTVEFTSNVSKDIEICKQKIGKIFNKWQNATISKDKSNAEDFLDEENSSFIDFCEVPSIAISNVTGQGYDKLIELMSLMKRTTKTTILTKDCLFIVHDIFSIPDVGQILHGTLTSGVLNTNDEVKILCSNCVLMKKVKTIQRKTIGVDRLNTGETGSITLYGRSDKNIDKTSVIFNGEWTKQIFTTCKVRPLFKNMHIRPQQYMLFVHNCTVIVNLTISEDSTFNLTCINGTHFFCDTDIGVLKDELNDYHFIKILF